MPRMSCRAAGEKEKQEQFAPGCPLREPQLITLGAILIWKRSQSWFLPQTLWNLTMPHTRLQVSRILLCFGILLPKMLHPSLLPALPHQPRRNQSILLLLPAK